jgi:hypothetical protein
MMFSEGGHCTLCRSELFEMYCVAAPKEFWYQQQVYSTPFISGNNRFGFGAHRSTE